MFSPRDDVGATQANDYTGELATYFRRYQRDRPEPVTIISSATAEGEAFLRHAHARLAEYHIYENTAPTYSPFLARQLIENGDPPLFAVLGTWNTAVVGSGGAWHGWNDLREVDSMPEALAGHGIHVVNEAYSKVQSWAEGSLQLADTLLENYFGIPRPWAFPAATVPIHVAQTAPFSPEDCEDIPDLGGGGSSGGGSGSPVVDDELTCFLAGTLVSAANRSAGVPIESLRQGDVVIAADGLEALVTAVLVHSVRDTTSVAVKGDVVGSLTHPVFHDGRWVDLASIADRIETRFVDAFYNLEIDAHRPGSDSQHAYLLQDGLLASGLGDNHALNTMFPRQPTWKRLAAAAADQEAPRT